MARRARTSFAQLKEGSVCACRHVPVTGPSRYGANAMAGGMPMTQKMKTQRVVEDHMTGLTRVPGSFSFTHEGTVVTKPKLNRIVPSTPAIVPVFGSVLIAGRAVS